MKNPFRAFLKASRMLSAVFDLQRMALSPEPTAKRAKTRAKPPKSRPRSMSPSPTRPAPGTFVDEQFSSPNGRLA